MNINKQEIDEIVKVIDWAISSGYNIKKNTAIMDILKKLVKELDLNSTTDDYFKDRYGIE